MTTAPMTSMERVLTTLSHKEPDRVPLFLLLTMHGAKELGLSIRDYFSKPEQIIEGQLRMQAKYRNDCFYPIQYGAADFEAFGGEILWFDDGPPNSGAPIIETAQDILALEVPKIAEIPGLQRTLAVIRGLKERSDGTVPIIGVVISAFSLPVMQMGFPAYIELLYNEPELFQRLMAINQEFCVAWANAQLQAGATAIGYFDPVASPELVPTDLYLRAGLPVVQYCLSRFKGPFCVHYASGRCLSRIDDLVALGAAAVGISTFDDLAHLKAACKGRISLLGNLNGISMRNWTATEAEQEVKEVIRIAGPGGGLILSDNHGEIPWQVSEDTLLAISEAVHQWGRYS
jgi:uroporphyrinogen decarboxylase